MSLYHRSCSSDGQSIDLPRLQQPPRIGKTNHQQKHQPVKEEDQNNLKHQPDMEEEGKIEQAESPIDSQQIISSDDEIDYSVKPEFYDPILDDKDELWVQKKRKGQYSDAVLSCPACFTTLSLECQRHEKYVTQYRAVFVFNCKIKTDEGSNLRSGKRKRGKRGRNSGDGEVGSGGGETFKHVCCSVCSTEIGVIDEEEVYHFFNVLPSEC